MHGNHGAYSTCVCNVSASGYLAVQTRMTPQTSIEDPQADQMTHTCRLIRLQMIILHQRQADIHQAVQYLGAHVWVVLTISNIPTH